MITMHAREEKSYHSVIQSLAAWLVLVWKETIYSLDQDEGTSRSEKLDARERIGQANKARE